MNMTHKKIYIFLIIFLLVLSLILYNGLGADLLKEFFGIQKQYCEEQIVYDMKNRRGCCAEDVTIFNGCSSGWINP